MVPVRSQKALALSHYTLARKLICIAEVVEEGVHLPSGVEEACHQPDDQVAAAHHSFRPVVEAWAYSVEVVGPHSCLGLEEELHSFPAEEGLRGFPAEAEEGLHNFPEVAEEGLHNLLDEEVALFETEAARHTTRPQEERNVVEEEAFLLSRSWEAAVLPSEDVVVRVWDVKDREEVVRNFPAHQGEAASSNIVVVS